MFYFLLMVLPLYPKTGNGYVFAVNLFAYTETSPFNRMIYWVMFTAVMTVGAAKILLSYFKAAKGQKTLTAISMLLGIFEVLFLAMTREAYGVSINACYSATSNDITFPAAILQPPAYDVNASYEENLGAAGLNLR